HRVDGVLQFEDFALHVYGDLLRQVAIRHGLGHGGDVADLAGQVGGHEVDAVGERSEERREGAEGRLPGELAVGTHFGGQAGHFGSERRKLIDHRVDGVFQFEDLALHVYGDLLGQVAIRHGRGDGRDVADLAGQVGRHEVDAVGE